MALFQRGEKTDGLTLVMAAAGILCCVGYGKCFCGAGGTLGRYCCDVCMIGEGRKEGRKEGKVS